VANKLEAAPAHEPSPLGYSMPGIVVYLNAIRQAFLNAGQGLRGYRRYIP